jgi:ferritin-like metal-binding protein YciE
MEHNASTMLDSMISTTDDPGDRRDEIEEMLKHHKQETERQEQRLCASAWTPSEQAPPHASRRRP